METEHQLQVTVIQWASMNEHRYPELRWLMAIPNGGARNVIVGAKLKREGVRRGVPDLFLPVARGKNHGLWIELKKRNGRTSPVQREWHRYLFTAGYRVNICFSFQEATDVLMSYLRAAIE